MSTTAVLRWICNETDGNLLRAIDLLTFENAAPARNTLLNKLKRHPGATKFYFESSGFIRVE